MTRRLIRLTLVSTATLALGLTTVGVAVAAWTDPEHATGSVASADMDLVIGPDCSSLSESTTVRFVAEGVAPGDAGTWSACLHNDGSVAGSLTAVFTVDDTEATCGPIEDAIDASCGPGEPQTGELSAHLHASVTFDHACGDPTADPSHDSHLNVDGPLRGLDGVEHALPADVEANGPAATVCVQVDWSWPDELPTDAVEASTDRAELTMALQLESAR